MTTVDMAATGRNIVKFREQTGITVRELQDMMGFGSVNTVYKWQNGKCLPTIDNLVFLAEIFHVKIDDIVATKTA